MILSVPTQAPRSAQQRGREGSPRERLSAGEGEAHARVHVHQGQGHRHRCRPGCQHALRRLRWQPAQGRVSHQQVCRLRRLHQRRPAQALQHGHGLHEGPHQQLAPPCGQHHQQRGQGRRQDLRAQLLRELRDHWRRAPARGQRHRGLQLPLGHPHGPHHPLQPALQRLLGSQLHQRQPQGPHLRGA